MTGKRERIYSQNKLSAHVALLVLITLLSGCLSSSNSGGGKRGSGGVSNSSSSVSPGYGRILKDNPIILSKNYSLAPDVNLNSLLVSSQDFITNNQFLIGSCSAGGGASIPECFETRTNESATYLSSLKERWAFNANSAEWLQVQTFGHMDRFLQKFHSDLTWTYSQRAGYQSSLPSTLFSSSRKAYFLGSQRLYGLSDCGVEDNAFYSPATTTMCLGHDSLFPQVKFAQDNTIIYHELGHTIAQVMMNMRGAVNSSISTRSALGYLTYDEAGSIGEGLADFFSFVMNKRTHFAEWALGRFLSLSRPMSEDDSLHAAGISADEDSRLSYPAYLNYDPNDPTVIFEDIHNAGMIFSHFLVATTNELQSYCGMTQDDSVQSVVSLVMESMAEMGDMTSFGADSRMSYGVNHSPDNALEWVSKANPINYRRFIQTFSKFFMRIYGSPSLARCGGFAFPQDALERLVDSYGLLLFRTYNDNLNGVIDGHAGTNRVVNQQNRIKSVYANKSLLKMDPRENASLAFVFDKGADVRNAMSALQASGAIGQISSQIPSDFGYNNGNGQISPGEVIGLSLSIYNDSNTTMAGVQVLANDWDHGKIDTNDANKLKPCNTHGDSWPLSSEGAADTSMENGNTPGECTYVTRENGAEAAETLAPVCWVQINETSSTVWASQDALRKKIALNPSSCLGGSDSPNDCFVRAIKGADQSFYSVINSKKTWAESVSNNGEAPSFNLGNVLFFEVSPWIPPGTTFNCRMRARFTNCEDCWHDANASFDDYLDYEFSGAKPFKILHFQFTVID
jgi:hypothetical protein